MPTYSGSYATPRLDLGVAMYEFMLTNKQFVSKLVLPLFGTSRKAATFSKITRDRMLAVGNVKRGPRSNYNRDTFAATDDSYACVERGHEAPLGDDERALYINDFDAERASSEVAMMRVLMDQEVDTAALVFNATTWTGSSLYTDVSAAPWATASTGIIAHILAAKEKVRLATGVDANALIINQTNLVRMLGNTGIREALHYTALPSIDALLKALSPLLGLEKIIVSGGVKNTAKEGQTGTVSEIWSADYAMVAKVANEGESLETPSIGRTFLWTADSPDSGGVTVETYREEQTRSDIYRARNNCDEKIFDAAYGHLLKVA